MTQDTIRKMKPFQESQEKNRQPLDEVRPTAGHAEPGNWNFISTGSPVSLADQKFELTRIKEQIEAELAQIDAALKNQLHEGDVASTHHGIGYRLSLANHEVYDSRAIRELSRMRLLPKFVKISTTKLKELVQDGKLSKQKFEHLRQYAITKEIVTLREVPLPPTAQQAS